MWEVEVEGNRIGLPMDYNDAVKVANEYALKGYRVDIIRVRDGQDV